MSLPESFWTTTVVVHVASGVFALLVGPIAMRAAKGGRAHRRAGLLFVWAMWVVCASAAVLLVRRPNVFLLVITILSFYQVFTGWRVLRRKRPGSGDGPTAIDWSVACVALVAGIGFVGWGVVHLAGWFDGRFPTVFYGLGIFFGIAISYDGWSDLRDFAMPKQTTGWWWIYHIARMSGAYIAMTTAFTVFQLSPHLPVAWQWVPWVAPAAIGTPWVRRIAGRYRQRFEAADSMRARRTESAAPVISAAAD